MKERPILYSAPMARQRNAGVKRMTRRGIKLPSWIPDPDVAIYHLREQCTTGKHAGLALFDDGRPVKRFTCPFGGPGDHLWGRETFRIGAAPEGDPQDPHYSLTYCADGQTIEMDQAEVEYGRIRPGKTYPSIHMPRWASRMLDLITAVKVEHVQDISEADIIAEGVTVPLVAELTGIPWSEIPTLFDAWRLIWCHINGKDSWDRDEWCWCISFRPVP